VTHSDRGPGIDRERVLRMIFGAAQSALIVAGVVAFGLAWALVGAWGAA
jgi:hypothetical protein